MCLGLLAFRPGKTTRCITSTTCMRLPATLILIRQYIFIISRQNAMTIIPIMTEIFRYIGLAHISIADIDECNTTAFYLRLNNCEQLCENLPGTFRCNCTAGYVLGEDNASCIGEMLPYNSSKIAGYQHS